MRLKKSGYFFIVIIFLVQTSVYAADYVWSSSSNTSWNKIGNWTPLTGFPTLSGDKATFNASSAVNCFVNLPTTIKALTIEAGYTGILTMNLTGSLTADDITLGGGKVVNVFADKLVAKKTLSIGEGIYTSLDIDCQGDASIMTLSLGALRFSGSDSHLTGVEMTPRNIVLLNFSEGKCTIANSFIAETLNVAPGASVTLGEMSSLSAGIHDVEGTIKLERLSALIFATGANIQGSIDASTSGSAVICNGNWNMTGTYTPTGLGTNVLTIIQSVNGDTINHGNNRADSVIVQNSVGQNTKWTSANQLFTLTVRTSTTLELAQNAILTIDGPIINAGKIIENPTGYIKHKADSVRAVNDNSVPTPAIVIGGAFRVNVIDLDELLDAMNPDVAKGIKIYNPRNGDTLYSEAIETGRNTTILLTSPIQTESGDAAIDDDKIQGIDNDELIITYTDNEDASDNEASSTLKLTLSSTNIPPTIQVLTPILNNEPSQGTYNITWLDSDPDNDAKISLYYDVDSEGLNGTLIIDNISEDGMENYYAWNTGSIPEGAYYIYAKIDDSVNEPVYDYSRGTVLVAGVTKQNVADHILGIAALSPDQFTKADLNADSVVDITDLILMINGQ